MGTASTPRTATASRRSRAISEREVRRAYTLHAYGSDNAYVDNYVAEDNIAYETGPFLIGGGRPSRNIKVLQRPLRSRHADRLRVRPNEGVEVRDNVIAGGKLRIRGPQTVVSEANRETLPGREARLIPNRYDPTGPTGRLQRQEGRRSTSTSRASSGRARRSA